MSSTHYEKLTFHRKDRYSFDQEPMAVAHSRFIPDQQALFAMAMIERWGMVAGTDAGEDSAGRAKIGLMPVGELVQRACDTAEQAYAVFEARGWLTPVPHPDELEEILQAKENAKENGRS